MVLGFLIIVIVGDAITITCVVADPIHPKEDDPLTV
jgi:hypothetical protein